MATKGGSTPLERVWRGDFLLGELVQHSTEDLVDLARHFLFEFAVLGKFALHLFEGELEVDLGRMVKLENKMRISHAALSDGRIQTDLKRSEYQGIVRCVRLNQKEPSGLLTMKHTWRPSGLGSSKMCEMELYMIL